MALTLSSLIVVMVAGTFLAQNRSYQVQLGVTDSHHNARAVTELLSSELRLVMEGGVVLAENDEITVRTPIVVAAVCWTNGVLVGVHTEGGEAAIETRAEEVTGFGVMDGVGGWDYYDVDWTTIDDASSSSVIAGFCYANGADTVGARDNFHSLKSLDSYHPTVPDVGEVILLFSKTTFKFQTSVLDPTTVGLFRQINGDDAGRVRDRHGLNGPVSVPDRDLVVPGLRVGRLSRRRRRRTHRIRGQGAGPAGYRRRDPVRVVRERRAEERTVRHASESATSRGGFVIFFVVLMLFAISITAVTGYLVVDSEFSLSNHAKEGAEVISVAHGGMQRFLADQTGGVGDSVVYEIGLGYRHRDQSQAHGEGLAQPPVLSALRGDAQ